MHAHGLGLLAWQLSKGHHSSAVRILHGAEILAGPYPQSFTDFIGQDSARLQILTAIASAGKRGKPMDHMLLASGIQGIGKTTLARLAAHAMAKGFLEIGGRVRDADAVSAITQMSDGDVLFLDEVHRLAARGKAGAEWMLTLLQDGSLQTPRGPVKAPAITVVAATTDAQKLPETILDRFPIKPILTPYADAEAVRIAKVTAVRMGFGEANLPMPAQDGWLEQVARASDNNPRRMSGLLTAVRDIALGSDLMNVDPDKGYDIDIALKWSGLTEDGLTAGACDYLLALWGYGGCAGASTLKAVLSEEQLGHTEKLLLQKGLVWITSRGRELTDYGKERAMELAKEALAEAQAAS